MHDQSAEGNDYFKCDFCLASWADDLPMVEGHRGSLICARCLTAAFTRVVVEKQGVTVPEHINCALCLMHHDSPHYAHAGTPDSPGGAVACERCIKQSAAILAKDPEAGWTKPTPPKP
jgi:hypothetical protein